MKFTEIVTVLAPGAAIPQSLPQCLDHLKQYLTLLFCRQCGAT